MHTVTWDGVDNAYIPGPELRIHPSLALDTEVARDVDGVTYEVIRHALWNINEEHGATIAKVSGSHFVTESHDYNTVIFSEVGECVSLGASIQYFGGTMDGPVKWTLENLSESPGIHEGDMFLSNDPWVGAVHQSDVLLTCPVFWNGRLFCWVGNGLHEYDLGGNTPGSFCVDAETVFDEPVPIPPIKMIEGGSLRRDLERMFLRHSRQPELLALDLRAQISGNLIARDRIVGLLERYGAPVVKSVMQRILSDGERTFATRLEAIPDGTWRHAEYLEAALPGDRQVHRVEMSVTKEGGTLTFSNRGSSPQVGAINAAYAGWRAGILSVINPFLCYDLLFAFGGPLRRLRFDPTPGTINCPTHPASVTNTQIANLIAGAIAGMCVGKMLGSAPELAREAFAVCGGHQFPTNSISGVDQHGREFGSGFLDPMGGAIGAYSWRDGIDTGGVWWDPQSHMPNVEGQEHSFPVLYLYRRELADSGGYGKHRGGNSGTFAIVPHKSPAVHHNPSTSGYSIPLASGIAGGGRCAPNNFVLRKDTSVLTAFAERRIPGSIEEIDGEDVVVMPKHRGLVQGPDDVWALTWAASGGYGDPLLRDPDAVARDVADGSVTAASAHAIYGVVLADQGVDAAATEARRGDLRRERLDGATPAAAGTAAPAGVPVAESIVAVGECADQLACAHCGHHLCARSGNYKTGCLVRHRELGAANPHVGDPSVYLDVEMEYREYVCPGCATLIDAEVARADDALLHDIELSAT